MSQNLGKTSSPPTPIFLVGTPVPKFAHEQIFETCTQLKIRGNSVWLSWKYILKYVAIMALLPKKVSYSCPRTYEYIY